MSELLGSATTAQTNGPETGSNGAEAWPVWQWSQSRSDGVIEPTELLDLARYVSQAAVNDSMFRPSMVYTGEWRDGGTGAATAKAAYDVYRTGKVLYGYEPFLLRDFNQRIRPPRQVQEDKGTCLDLAAAFAATCIEAQLRAHLLMLTVVDPRSLQEFNHALVLLDLRMPYGDPTNDELDGPFLRDPDAPWIHEVAPFADEELPPYLVAIDITRAATAPGHPDEDYRSACTSGAEHLKLTKSGWAVDVQTARTLDDEYPAGYPAPKREAFPAISHRLPGGYHYLDFDSRADADRTAHTASGRIVIRGEQGSGKSTLAHHRAAGADHGYGWFLTASDRQTLITELAEAELAEHPLRTAGDVYDPTSLASAALARLIESRSPWVVVLDNADCDPSALAGLIPRPQQGQTLIITTTNPEWLGGAWASHEPVTNIELEPVHDQDLRDVDHPLPGWAWEAIGGSPLLARAVLGAVRAGAVLHDSMRDLAGHELAWHLVRQLDDVPAHALEAAVVLAWLPAEPVRTETLADLVVPEPVAGVARLNDLGLIDRAPGGVTRMHRLFRRAIVEHPPAVAPDPVTRILHLAGDSRIAVGRENILLSADVDLLTRMARHLDALPTPAPATAWFCLGRILEYRGSVPLSVELYRKALGDAEGTAELSTAMRSACLLGQARWPFQNARATLDEIVEGQRLADEAVRAVGDGSAPVDVLARERARALGGLLERKRIGKEEVAPEERRLRLEAVVAVLLDSLERRRAVLLDHPDLDLDDVDRGVFNLGGTYLPLARTSPPELRSDLLRLSAQYYLDALDIRTQRFDTRANPHVASCLAGLMMVPYYEVVLDAFVEDDEPEKYRSHDPHVRDRLRHECLRSATAYAVRALAQREFFEGALDGNDTGKTTKFLAKVSLARIALASAAAPKAKREAPREDVDKELADFFEETKDWWDLLVTDEG